MGERVKVLYIAGTGKSGSTLLGKLLGQIDGFVDVGELINMDSQHLHNEKCGCGLPVQSCEFWTQVVERSIGSIDRLDRNRWARLKTRYLPLLAIPGAESALRRYFAQLQHIQVAVSEVGQARAIVDSSKSAFYGAVLALFRDFDVYTLHLVRDVRASEGSMYRLKTEGAGKFAGRSTWWNSLRWMLVNLMTEWASRRVGSKYLRIRYEDLVENPKKTLKEILQLIPEATDELDFLEGRMAILGKTHSIAGSNVRFKECPIELRLDERWKESLPERNRAMVDGLTKRFRQRYGY